MCDIDNLETDPTPEDLAGPIVDGLPKPEFKRSIEEREQTTLAEATRSLLDYLASHFKK